MQERQRNRPDDGDAVGLRNAGFYKSLDTAVRPRNLYEISCFRASCDIKLVT
jgi:hypothetical protein